MDNYFRAQNKKILLLIDNAPSHITDFDLDPDDDDVSRCYIGRHIRFLYVYSGLESSLSNEVPENGTDQVGWDRSDGRFWKMFFFYFWKIRL